MMVRWGSAWVACGYHDIDHYTEYELLTMPEEFHPGGTFVFLISDSYTTDFDIRTYFYMNWDGEVVIMECILILICIWNVLMVASLGIVIVKI